MFLLQPSSRAGENGTVLQIQLAGRAHWLESQSEVAVFLGWNTLSLYNSIWLYFHRERSRHRPNQVPEQNILDFAGKQKKIRESHTM